MRTLRFIVITNSLFRFVSISLNYPVQIIRFAACLAAMPAPFVNAQAYIGWCLCVGLFKREYPAAMMYHQFTLLEDDSVVPLAIVPAC